MDKIGKLIEALIGLAEEVTTYYKRMNGAPIEQKLPLGGDAAPAPKTRTKKVKDEPQHQEPEQNAQAQMKAAEAALRNGPAGDAAQQSSGMDMLGLGGSAQPQAQQPPLSAPKKEYTEKESAEVIFKITEKYMVLTQKEPAGKQLLIERMQNHYKVGKLQDLVHAQRVEWIEWVEKLIAEHK